MTENSIFEEKIPVIENIRQNRNVKKEKVILPDNKGCLVCGGKPVTHCLLCIKCDDERIEAWHRDVDYQDKASNYGFVDKYSVSNWIRFKTDGKFNLKP